MKLRELILKHDFNVVCFVWGVAEALLFFIVPDVALSYVGLKRGPRAAAIASIFAALGAACGGALMFWWSSTDPTSARETVLAVPAISEAMAGNWFLATLLGPLSSTPYKLYAVLAPQAGASLPAFAAASVVARLPRFLIVSAGVAFIGHWLQRRVSMVRLSWLLAAFWLVFYAVFFARMPN
jgi:hypothetical protein